TKLYPAHKRPSPAGARVVCRTWTGRYSEKEITMSRTLKFALAAAAALLVGLIGATAIAGRAFHHWHGPGAMRRHVSAVIDGALGSARATPAQRSAIGAARDRAFATIEESHRGHRGDLDGALGLFEADRLDPV